jgi:hypothetical protein
MELYLPSGCSQTNQGGRVVQGRTIVLCYTCWCLYEWKLLLPSSWCWNTQGVGSSFKWVLEKPKSWFSQQVVACKIEVLASGGVGAHISLYGFPHEISIAIYFMCVIDVEYSIAYLPTLL